MIFKTTPEQKVQLYEIAAAMNKDKSLKASFVAAAVKVAELSQGVFDLMTLWRDEKDQKEREEIVADIQDSIEDWETAKSSPIERPKISFENFEETIKNIKKFKKKLRDLIDQRGGITALAEKTGIPQPSLSRMFNSGSMPRKTTLYKIAVALDLEEKDIISDYAS